MDDDLLRQRRNLLSISFILLLFILGGGDVESLFGVKLEHGCVAVIFAWIGLFYFWWRFWVFGGGEFKEKILENCLMSVVEKQNFDEFEIDKSDGDISRFLGFIGQPLREVSVTFRDSGNDFLVCYGAIDRLTMKAEWNGQFRVSYSLSRKILRRNILHAVIRDTATSDYFLPHMIAVLVVLVGFFRFIYLLN